MRQVVVCLFLLAAASCSSEAPKAYLPVDSPLHAWAAPEHDEAPAPAPAPAAAPKPPEKKAPKK